MKLVLEHLMCLMFCSDSEENNGPDPKKKDPVIQLGPWIIRPQSPIFCTEPGWICHKETQRRPFSFLSFSSATHSAGGGFLF